MAKLIGLLGVIVIGLFVLACANTSNTYGVGSEEEIGVGVPITMSENGARVVFEDTLKNECLKRRIAITSGLTSALRTVPATEATKSLDHWSFSDDGRTAKVYQSGAVTGELMSYLVGLCGRGNR